MMQFRTESIKKMNYRSMMSPMSDSLKFEFGEDLPSLACDAAIELDNLILKRSKKLESVNRLITTISEAGLVRNHDEEGVIGFRYIDVIDPLMALVLNGAIGDSKFSISKETVQELLGEAKKLTMKLKNIVSDPEKASGEEIEETKRLKSFCLALSKRALLNEPALHDFELEHPPWR